MGVGKGGSAMSDTGAQGPEPGGAEQQMRMPTVPELVLSTAQLAISLAADEIARKGDLEQAQLAIDTVDALMPAAAREPEPPKDTQPTVETPPRPPIWTPGGDV